MKKNASGDGNLLLVLAHRHNPHAAIGRVVKRIQRAHYAGNGRRAKVAFAEIPRRIHAEDGREIISREIAQKCTGVVAAECSASAAEIKRP